MAHDAPRTPSEKWFVALALALLVYVAVLAGVAAYQAARGPAGTNDFEDFHRTVTHFLKHRTYTQEYGAFGYPPFFVMLMVPLAIEPVWLASLIWSAANVVMLAAVISLVDRIIVPPRVGNPLIRVAVPVACCMAYIHACLFLGQLGILVLFLLVIMWVLYEQKQEWWAGLMLALAIQVKVFPALWLAYWLVKRRWRLVGGTVVGTAFCLVLTVQGYTAEESWRAHKEWFTTAQDVWNQAFREGEPTQDGGMRVQNWRFLRFRNEAMSFTLRRLLSDVRPAQGDARPDVSVLNLSPAAVHAVYRVMMVGLLVWLTAMLVRPARQCTPMRMRWEAAIMMLAPLWFSPILWIHYLPLAYPALAMLAVRLAHDHMLGRRNRAGLVGLAVWIGATVMLASPHMRAAGIHLWATMVLVAALAAQARRAEAPTAAPPRDIASDNGGP